MAQSWTPQKVLDRIQVLHAKGEEINSWHVQYADSSLFNAALKYFGGWRNAVTAAGIDYTTIKKNVMIWTQDAIKNRIQEIFKTHGQVNYWFVFRRWPVVVVSARKRFGTYEAAVKAAGIDYDQIRKARPCGFWNESQIINQIRERYENALPLSSRAVNAQYGALYGAALQYFGKKGWSKALLAAGINPDEVSRSTTWSKQEVLDEIQNLYDFGVSLRQRSMQVKHSGLFKAARRCFGNWPEAVTAAGLDYQKIIVIKPKNYWSKKTVIAEIRRLKKAGLQLNHKDLMNKNHGGVIATARVLFGSWDQAVEAAGFNYLEHCRVFSTKAWLRRLTKSDVTRLEERADTLNQEYTNRKRRKS